MCLSHVGDTIYTLNSVFIQRSDKILTSLQLSKGHSMYKKYLSISLIAGLMFASNIALADQSYGNSLFSNQNIGRVLGTGLGAYLGSKVGKGRGNDAAIAVGAVGGYVVNLSWQCLIWNISMQLITLIAPVMYVAVQVLNTKSLKVYSRERGYVF